jgi:hypothetical protein
VTMNVTIAPEAVMAFALLAVMRREFNAAR